jgi:CubicO group peptidase (beta-lactamase class C family)
MLKSRAETLMALVVTGIGLIITAILGLWGYMSATSAPLHPSAAEAPSVAQSSPQPQWISAVEKARTIARAALTEQNLPGLSIAVGGGGDIVWAEGFGWANLETRVPVAPDMMFRIGTASVPLTSVAVGLLLEQGRLELDEPIQRYVPEAPAEDWPVTLRQVMAHVAGVANDGGDEGPLYSQHCERPADALHFLSGYERQLLFAPGTRYSYSSYGWIMVSAAVEAAAGERFLSFMQKQVFDPLRMRHTMADSLTELITTRATPYFPRFAADPRYGPDPVRPTDYSCYAGASVFQSTPSDLVRFGMSINSGTLLRPAMVQLLQTSQRLPSGQETGYGLGWDLETVTLAGVRTHWVGHNGTAFGGTLASLITFPDRGLVVAVISNTSYADTPSLALKIAESFVEGASGSTRR